jgi:AraC-like DNA-binding protein
MLYSTDFGLKIYSIHTLSWEKQKKYAYPRPYHALSLRLKGQADFVHNDKVFSVKENDIIFVPKNYDYTLNAYQQESVIVIHFDSTVPFPEIQTFTPTDPSVFVSLFNQLEKTYSQHQVGYKQKLYSLFYEILEQVQIQREKEYSRNIALPNYFKKSIDYLNANFTDPELTVESLAKIANVSTVYYRKIFKSVLGISPCKHLCNMRLKKAKNLLKTGYYTVEQVAYDCGFNDSKYFSTCYKNMYGISPGKDVTKLFKNL